MVSRVEIVQEFSVVSNLANSGHYRRATRRAIELTRRFPKLPEAHNQLGELLLTTGANKKAADSFRDALELNPNMIEAHNGLGNALEDLGLFTEAIASYRTALRHDPHNVEALNNLGNALDRVERYEEAASYYETAVRLCPEIAELHLNLGKALERLKRHAEAIASYKRALAIEPMFVEVYNDLGLSYDALSEHRKALNCYLKAVELKPDFPEALNNLGHCLHSLGRNKEAIGRLQEALKLKPEFPEAHHNLAVALDRLGRSDEAITHYQQALSLKPDFAQSHSGLCQVYERSNKIDEMKQVVSAAKAACGEENAFVRFCDGQLASALKRSEEARTLLNSIDHDELPFNLEITRRTLLGKTCDTLGGYRAAYAEFEGANRLIASHSEGSALDPDKYLKDLNHLTASWSDGAAALQTDQHSDEQLSFKLVFLIGFPRSGTTLLDTIMRSHPAIAVAEELPMVTRMREHLGALPTADVVGALSGQDTAALRQAYLSELTKQLGPIEDASVVIDKLPLNIINVGLINRVFPNARYVLSLRHPLDCVLSCFIQNFDLNNAMANFLDLDRTAKVYDGVMSLWARYEGLGVECQSLKYEQLVHDLRGSTVPLLNFLGLDWHDDMEAYRTTALSRTRINTPSYNQVTEPLYLTKVERWRNYKEHLRPIFPTLEPWVKKWGYEI